MVMPKPPKKFCVDEFVYREHLGSDGWEGAKYADPVTIRNCRIDRGAEFTTPATGKQLLYNAVVFCYADITTPLPEFKTESIVIFDDIEHKVTKVIPIYEAYERKIYSYELEVI